jgi:valyl-tRNA synthetase
MIPKHYEPQKTEKKIYSLWEKSGFFNPDVYSKKKPCSKKTFSIVLPPPNVTGVLHLGHALGITVEDILVRFYRMKGYQTLWLPGTDHAAIATQSKVENILLKKEKKSRHDLKKEDFMKMVHDFASQSRATILEQIKMMGASVDWSREAYTLDEKRNKAVIEAFSRFYQAGLIYRGTRIVNWDPKGQTTVSDDEVIHQESQGTLYTFRYSQDFPIPIATTRPETKLGDTALAVNPQDKRYQKYIGKEFLVDFVGQPLKIKVVADKEVDPGFGTGALGVTPAHSSIDWQIAQRHGLEVKSVINEYARICTENPLYSGLKIKEAREKIIERLKENNLLIKQENISHSIAQAERTGGIIEPLPKEQWFIDVNKEFKFPHSSLSFVKKNEKTTLKKLLEKAVSKKHVSIVPQRFEKTYFYWINNLQDWCISRQIWFGHQIPAYYNKNEISVGEKPSKEWTQDPDTLDTWFSSGLWTFSTLGWPDQTKDFKKYHPTNVLETGYDILFFWVARMILMSTFLLGEVPFKKVYLHGLVRDEQGRKMSKSLGNSINPTEMTDKYGTDALRMSLIIGSAPGNDIRISEAKIKAQKHFANKIWNASRYVLLSLPQDKKELNEIISDFNSLKKKDLAWKKKLAKHLEQVTKDIENYRFDLAAEKIYHYFWHTFADVIIEESKTRINKEKISVLKNLYFQLTEQLKIMHPFMPFITEEIWSLIPKGSQKEKLIMVEKWPIK